MRPTEDLFRRLATLRGARAFHPVGTTYEGQGAFDGEETAVVARLSRGAGLPEPLPDLLGIAVRWVDRWGPGRHQDLLLTSALGSAPVLRHVLRPSRHLDRVTCTTIAPHRGTMLRARCRGGVIAVDAAPTLGRSWRPLASAVLAGAVDHDVVRFDPWNTTPELEPVNVIHALRRPAYVGSREGFPT